MAAHRYWRVRCPTTWIAGNYFGIAEFQARLTSGGADQTTGKTASANTYLSSTYAPSKGIDDNASTFWTTGGTAPPAGGHWFSVDLGSAMDIVEITIKVRPDTYREDPKDLYIESSDDGSTWTTEKTFLAEPSWTAGEERTYSVAAPPIVVPIENCFTFVEPLSEGDGNIRSSLVIAEPLTEGSPKILQSFNFVEPLTEGFRKLRMSLFLVEVLHPIGPEEYMSTTPFPGFGNSASNPAVPAGADPFNTALPGLGFSVHKKPAFRTRVAETAGGQEDRSAFWEMPKWDFELTYEFLEDRSGAESSLKTIVGFFLSMQGAFDTWLFKDPDDYKVELGSLGETDGVTTQFYFKRALGAFYEVIGQVDTANDINLYLEGYENGTIPGSGPYTITVANPGTIVDLGVTKAGLPMTKVSGAPGNEQYAVNQTTGVYTFSNLDDNEAVIIHYRYPVDPADYTVTMPNSVIFDSAPDDGWTLYADFQFYFVCRFIEDMMDFEKFADKLWSLQTCEFRSMV